IVAPTVRRAHRGWRVVLPMHAGHPDAARVVELAALTFGPDVAVEVAVVAPYTAVSRPRPPATQNKERIASAMSAGAGIPALSTASWWGIGPARAPTRTWGAWRRPMPFSA